MNMRGLQKILFLLCLLMIEVDVYAAQDVPVATMVLENSACLQCHQQQDSALIKSWQESAHATTDQVVDCVSCHGALHENMAVKARADNACIDCHGGKTGPVTHSYSSSKHGVLMRLEKDSYDWKQSFVLANYRAPGCGYCHMHQNNHDVSTTARHDLMGGAEVEAVKEKIGAVCQECHSPRYITRLFSNGESMLEIARKKVREADALISQAEKFFAETELEPAKRYRQKMQHHLKNVHLGIAHQSPDYQWWHGQPALDGDLLRIKDSIGELYRLKE